MKQPKDYTKYSKLFKDYTGLSLKDFMDWKLSLALNQINFDILKYMEWCEKQGMKDEESIEEFNLRYFDDGRKLNKLILSFM